MFNKDVNCLLKLIIIINIIFNIIFLDFKPREYIFKITIKFIDFTETLLRVNGSSTKNYISTTKENWDYPRSIRIDGQTVYMRGETKV